MSTKNRGGRGGLVAALAVALGLVASGPARGAPPKGPGQPATGLPLPLHLSAAAVNLVGLGPVRMVPVEITIERWSTDEERDRLRDALVEKGSDALMKRLQDIKPRVGFIRTSTSLGWDIRYARAVSLPGGGWRIVFGTDRPRTFAEVANNAVTTQYDFIVGQIQLTADGKGTGKLANAARVTYDNQTRSVEIENWEAEPVRLEDVRMTK